MFSGPEHESYRELMRELRLPRVYWQPGDLRWESRADPDAWPDQIVVISDRESAEAASMAGNRDVVWLPTLADWLSMLKAAGVAGVDFNFRPPVASIYRYGKHAATERELVLLVKMHDAKSATLEEACARLWCAVTGREVTG